MLGIEGAGILVFFDLLPLHVAEGVKRRIVLLLNVPMLDRKPAADEIELVVFGFKLYSRHDFSLCVHDHDLRCARVVIRTAFPAMACAKDVTPGSCHFSDDLVLPNDFLGHQNTS